MEVEHTTIRIKVFCLSQDTLLSMFHVYFTYRKQNQWTEVPFEVSYSQL